MSFEGERKEAHPSEPDTLGQLPDEATEPNEVEIRHAPGEEVHPSGPTSSGVDADQAAEHNASGEDESQQSPEGSIASSLEDDGRLNRSFTSVPQLTCLSPSNA